MSTGHQRGGVDHNLRRSKPFNDKHQCQPLSCWVASTFSSRGQRFRATVHPVSRPIWVPQCDPSEVRPIAGNERAQVRSSGRAPVILRAWVRKEACSARARSCQVDAPASLRNVVDFDHLPPRHYPRDRSVKVRILHLQTQCSHDKFQNKSCASKQACTAQTSGSVSQPADNCNICSHGGF